MIVCRKCERELPASAFPRKRTNRAPKGWCTECVRAKRRNEDRAKRASNPFFYRAQDLWRNYRMTLEDYDRMLAAQGGVCNICGAEPELPPTRIRDDIKVLVVDHDHVTGKVRGLLCRQCNSRLGILEMRAWVAKAQAYLARHA